MTLAIFDSPPPEPCPAPFNLADYVLRAGQATPDKVALSVLTLTGAERWSFAKLDAAVRGTAAGLREHGLSPGDRVLLRLGNSVAFPVAFLACIGVGLIPVPTSALLTAPEVTRIADHVRPALVVAEPGVSVPDQNIPTLSAVALAEMRTLAPAQFTLGDPERPAYIIFTSGTAGMPRAVVHAHRAIWARRMMWEGWYGLRDSDRVLHAGAFNWTYTLGTGLLDPWSIGATALIPGPGVTARELPLLLKRHDATIFAAAPGVYRQMLRQDVAAMPKLRHGLSAGEKLPEITRQRWCDATETELHEAYGMSECSTFVSGCPANPAPPDTLGQPQTGRRVALLDDKGVPVTIGKPGNLAVSRNDPGLMLGYWNPAKAAPDLISSDWFPTGDIMRMETGNGTLRYLGRSDDMLNAGGFRVSPIEIESAFALHPDIIECAAVEVQVREDTSIIALYYTGERDIDASELEGFGAARLARYKQPRRYCRLPSLPKNPNGKVQRRVLRATSSEN